MAPFSYSSNGVVDVVTFLPLVLVCRGGRRFGRWLSRLIRLVNRLLLECSR
jgi:hypothetical protein